MCFVWLSEQTATFVLYCINRLVFITEVESIYCTVRTESLYSVIQKDGLNFVRLYFLNYTCYVNELHNIWKKRS